MQLLSGKDFKRSIRNRELRPIDGNGRFQNLAHGYWVYDELLSALKRSGWFRFAPGYKAGLYGNRMSPYCVKILGMGVGDNPLYFCERGYYLEHEARMLMGFRERGFYFGPEPLSAEDSIRFLVDDCDVTVIQAEQRVLRNDVLVMEVISGVPYATQTGRFLNYDLNIVQYDKGVIEQMVASLRTLRTLLSAANDKLLLHNDPMPPNIIFTLDEKDNLIARLVDFELSQDLRMPSPGWVNNSVRELYDERDVQRNTATGKHTKNLDQHLMDRSIEVAETIQSVAPRVRSVEDFLKGIDLEIPFVGGFSFNVGETIEFLRDRWRR